MTEADCKKNINFGDGVGGDVLGLGGVWGLRRSGRIGRGGKRREDVEFRLKYNVSCPTPSPPKNKSLYP